MSEPRLDETHDPQLRSWVVAANLPEADFPLQNLPHGVFRRRGLCEAWRGGVAIGDQVLDLAAAQRLGLFHGLADAAALQAGADTLNGLMALGRPAWKALRLALSRLLREAACERSLLQPCLIALADVEMRLPARIGDYTDFFSSATHALNAGRVLRPDAPPLPNFRWLPIGYHGRASSVEAGDSSFLRPCGQRLDEARGTPTFGPTRRLDYELEVGAWIGPGNRSGQPIPIAAAADHVFGLCLLNDWSARDLQAWEALPLGPFLAKSFATTVSPWIVTLEALAPFRCALPRAPGEPPELPYLREPDPGHAGLDIELEARLECAATGPAGARLSRTSLRHAHWSFAQMVAHHSSNGCRLRPGDLFGSGTQSGPNDGEQGCLLELTHGGRRPLPIAAGQSRTWLEDGDTIELRAWCERPGQRRIGFGACRGRVLPALPAPGSLRLEAARLDDARPDLGVGALAFGELR